MRLWGGELGRSGGGVAAKRGLLLAGVLLLSYGLVSSILLYSTSEPVHILHSSTGRKMAPNSSDYEFVPAFPEISNESLSLPSLAELPSTHLVVTKATPPPPSSAPARDRSRGERQQERRPHPMATSPDPRPLCPDTPPGLRGKLSQSELLMNDLKEADVSRRWTELEPGGEWSPPDCRSRHKVAIIFPYRDRQSHLNRLLDFLIPVLMRQLLDFRFIVTEQYGSDLFNKGRIMNAAFELAEWLGVDCVVFHDVDMFPQDDRGPYGCPPTPRHMGAFVNSLGYELWYDYLVGGVLSFRMEHYREVNGYSNMYWAWGGEDDDMGKRLLHHNLTIDRPSKEIMSYTMLKHTKRQRTAPKLIYQLLGEAEKRHDVDGLRQRQWRMIKLIRKPLYYHLYVDVGRPPKEWRAKA